MTSIAIRLHKNSVTTSIGAVASLQHVADERGVPVQRGKRLDVIVPANPGSHARHVEVTAGRWLVEATLPSGEVISEEVAVSQGQDVPVTLFAAERSPHEWLGWQYLVGNIEGAQTLRLLREKAQETARLAINAIGKKVDAHRLIEELGRSGVANLDLGTFAHRPSVRVLVENLGRLGADVTDVEVPMATATPTVRVSELKSGTRGADAWTAILSPDSLSGRSQSASHEDRANSTWLYELPGPTDPSVHHFANVEWRDARFAVSLPLPWPALEGRQHVPAQLMVRMHPVEGNVQIGLVVQDPDFAAVAGLMTASTLSKATVAVKQASHMLYAKTLHPLGAAAGGYILLAAGETKETEWHGWIDNLDAWFPNVPDGAILKASLRLRFPKSRDAHAEARTALLNAFDRGIPYYSAGVSWLLDGLTMFADDPLVEEKMRIVQRVALRLDLSQAFTVVRTSERVK